MIFRRGRRERESEGVSDVPAFDDVADAEEREGPWDANDAAPDLPRFDFGGIRVPIVEGVNVQINIDQEQGQVVAVTLMSDDSALQIQAFAAPKRGGVWNDVRRDILTDLTASGGKAEEVGGAFGPELAGEVPVEVPGQGVTRQAVRFIGVDGPRWLLQGVISGAAGADVAAAEPLEEIFRGVIVVRGDHPMPPKERIELQLPPEARPEGEDEEEEEPVRPDLRPFERGPEITETR